MQGLSPVKEAKEVVIVPKELLSTFEGKFQDLSSQADRYIKSNESNLQLKAIDDYDKLDDPFIKEDDDETALSQVNNTAVEANIGENVNTQNLNSLSTFDKFTRPK